MRMVQELDEVDGISVATVSEQAPGISMLARRWADENKSNRCYTDDRPVPHDIQVREEPLAFGQTQNYLGPESGAVRNHRTCALIIIRGWGNLEQLIPVRFAVQKQIENAEFVVGPEFIYRNQEFAPRRQTACQSRPRYSYQLGP